MPDSTLQAFWVIVTDPGCVPERKGPVADVNQLAAMLRELMDARPLSHLIVARIDGDQLYVDDGTQALELIDGRSAPKARRHRERLQAGRSGTPGSPEKAAGPAPLENSNSSRATH